MQGMAINDLVDKPIKQRATRVKEVVMPDGREGWEYSDGSVRDVNGRALSLPPKMRMITSDNAHDMIRLREEKRNRLYAEGAQLSVQNKKLIEKYGDDAHIIERAMTLQTIASTPDAGKAAVLADQQLQRAQGYDVKDATPAQLPAQVGTSPVLLLIAELARRGEIVDGEITDG